MLGIEFGIQLEEFGNKYSMDEIWNVSRMISDVFRQRFIHLPIAGRRSCWHLPFKIAHGLSENQISIFRVSETTDDDAKE